GLDMVISSFDAPVEYLVPSYSPKLRSNSFFMTAAPESNALSSMRSMFLPLKRFSSSRLTSSTPFTLTFNLLIRINFFRAFNSHVKLFTLSEFSLLFDTLEFHISFKLRHSLHPLTDDF